MEAFSVFLLKSIVWLTGFALVYLLFLRYERFFLLKRIYLLTGIVVSLIFPLISIHYTVEVPAPAFTQSGLTGTGLPGSPVIQEMSQSKPFDYGLILLGLYVSGIIFLGYRIIRHILLLRKTINKAEISSIGPARLVRIKSFPASFSFFNYVFINPSVDEAEVREIMNHELVHVYQRHWLDMMLIEMLRLFQWMNPFVWIYTGFIRLNNEYLADELVLQRSSNPGNYKAALMNQLFRSPVISLSSSFNYSLNKRRFNMMKKIITSPYRKLKVLLVLPVFAIVLYAFAKPEFQYIVSDNMTDQYSVMPAEQNITVRGEVKNVEGIPLPNVIVVISGTTTGTITDSNGKFVIGDVPENGSLVISCKGYLTQTLKAEPQDIVIQLVKDPEFKEDLNEQGTGTPTQEQGTFNFRDAFAGDLSDVLIVVDGVITDRGNLDKLNPNDIESVSVRKDPAVTAPYGEKGKNGVIIIKTKNPLQKPVKGIVVDKDGKPLPGTYISSTGTLGNAMMAESGQDGRFSIQNVQPDAVLIFFCRGYKGIRLNPDFNDEMRVVLEIDTEYKGPTQSDANAIQARKVPLVIVDGEFTDKNLEETRKDLGYDFGQFRYLNEGEAHVKYGEKGVNGVFEVTTRKKAFEMGIRTPFPRLTPDDYPTFQGKSPAEFSSWIIDHAEYPAEAKSQNIGGYVTVNFTVGLDGSLSNISSLPNANLLLASEIVRVISSSPQWDPPKNPAVDEPFASNVIIHFRLPDQIELWQEPFVVVEEMPMYPGGDEELLKFIAMNTQYPEEARVQKIEGRVIARFFVSTEGTAEAVTVLKGVHPLLDAEAIRVVSMLKGFTPGKQNGKPVNVWYMVPITFTLNKPDTPQ